MYKAHGREKYCKECWYSIKPPKQISPRSQAQMNRDDKYSRLRKKFLAEHSYCVGKLEGCTGHDPTTLSIQHKRGRIGDLYLDVRYWIPLCINCHRWVNEHPKEAGILGLAESRLKAEE